jgi:L-threonylcarbamoyladenylate synthase
MLILSSLNDPRLPELLKNGAVGVVPTDTIYGVVADARNIDAVTRLYRLKHREHKPGTIIAANIDQLIKLGVDEPAIRRVKHLWPNALSIVVPVLPALAYLDQQVGSLAVRIPKDEPLCALLVQTGPIVTSSANHPGMTPATNIATARAYFGSGVDFYVDGGELDGRPPSTVVRLHSDGHLEVLRQGAVTIE